MAIFERSSQKADALKDIPLFNSLSNKERLELARHVDEIPVRSDTLLTVQGGPGDAFYLIVEGRADVMRNDTKIATLGPGDTVGEMALLDGEPRSATVVMTSDGVVLTMPRREFTAVLRELPAIALKMLVALSLRLREANSRMIH
jgi:CRP/FNR family transcriptional regulator, cyclic AMP receptor protein